MDALDALNIGSAFGLIGYGLGYLHKTLTLSGDQAAQSIQESLNEAVGQCALYATMLMDEHKLSTINCTADLEGRIIKMVISDNNIGKSDE